MERQQLHPLDPQGATIPEFHGTVWSHLWALCTGDPATEFGPAVAQRQPDDPEYSIHCFIGSHCELQTGCIAISSRCKSQTHSRHGSVNTPAQSRNNETEMRLLPELFQNDLDIRFIDSNAPIGAVAKFLPKLEQSLKNTNTKKNDGTHVSSAGSKESLYVTPVVATNTRM